MTVLLMLHTDNEVICVKQLEGTTRHKARQVARTLSAHQHPVPMRHPLLQPIIHLRQAARELNRATNLVNQLLDPQLQLLGVRILLHRPNTAIIALSQALVHHDWLKFALLPWPLPGGRRVVS